MYIATLNLSDEEVQALIKLKPIKKFNSVDQMLTSWVQFMIATNLEPTDPNQTTISLDDKT